MARKKKREEYDEDSFLDEEIDAWEDDEEEEDDDVKDVSGEDDDAEADDDEEDANEEAEAKEVEYPPDDKKAVAALKKLHTRLDVGESGNVWRAILSDAAKDQALVLLDGLPALKEVWLLGTKVSPDAAKKFKEEHPDMTVYY